MTKKQNHMKNGKPISRRDFIARTAAGATAVTVFPASVWASSQQIAQDAWPKYAKSLRFHMIGHGHIDPVWLWPWTEGISIVHSTFRSALDRMNEVPGLIFTCSSAQFYEWVAKNDPKMLAEIRKRVDEGRWNIVGGWWVEPDVNIPSGEALVRQGLYGQLTFQRLLGQRAKVAFNADSFGHAQTLPQIFKQQGMDKYVFMRPGPHEKTLPADLFWWEGPDGSRVLAYRIQQSYSEHRSVRNRLMQIVKVAENQPMKVFMGFYGIGDHGGGPTKMNIQTMAEVQKEKDAPTIFYSSPDKYFEEVLADKKLKIPVVKDDLQHHAPGCYTAEWEIKKGNRLSEAALVTTEKISAIGSVAWGVDYPMRDLTAAWHKVLFLQFHDSAAGTSLVEHSQAAREGYNRVLDVAHENMYMAVQKLEWQIPAEDPESEYVILFNPHAWEVKQKVEYDLGQWSFKIESPRVEDEQGNPIYHQWTGGQTETDRRQTLIFDATIPPMGYRQIRLMNGTPRVINNPVKAEGNVLENQYLRVRFSENGTLGILDKETGKEVFAGGTSGCKAIVIDDPSDTWSHGVVTFSDEIGAFGNATIKVLENGPMRAKMRVKTSYGNSYLTIDWILYFDSRHLEAKVTLDWHEHLKMLKFSFPVNIESPVATYETPYGYIVRATKGEEDPGQRWIDLSGKRDGNACGLTIINDAKYGYNVIENDMRVSVTRSAVFAHHRPKVLDPTKEYVWMEQGIQTFRMMLVPHKETWRESNIVRMAEEFIAPTVTIYQGIHGGTMAKSGSFLSIDKDNVIVSSVKCSEEGEDIIIRCVESTGKATNATLDLRFVNRKWSGDFRACEIKTIRVNPKTGTIREVNLLEE